MKESENIYAMPELMSIQIHRSKETGELYINYIGHFDEGFIEDGLWTDISITEADFQNIVKFLASKPPINSRTKKESSLWNWA